MTIRVRPAQPADGPSLFGVWSDLRSHNAVTDRRIIPAPVSEAEFLEGLAQVFQRRSSATFIAEMDGRLAGFISGGIETNQPDRLPERHATVGYLYVEPACRRQGVGRQLFAAFARWAESHDDIAHFEMPVLALDRGAESFWKALGFTPFIQRLWAPLSAADGPD